MKWLYLNSILIPFAAKSCMVVADKHFFCQAMAELFFSRNAVSVTVKTFPQG